MAKPEPNMAFRARPGYHPRMQISVSIFSQMLRYVASLDIDVEWLLRSSGLDPEILKTPDARIPIETHFAIQEEAIRISKDEFFGLHAGEFAEAGSYSILGYMMINCRNLLEAGKKSERYARIVTTVLQVRTQIGLRKVRLIYSPSAFGRRSRGTTTIASFPAQSGRCGA